MFRTDSMAFQVQLLCKQILYSADVKYITSGDGNYEQCSFQNLRILEDITGARSILYFAERRPYQRSAGFLEWRRECHLFGPLF
jgi:hypothetical protein